MDPAVHCWGNGHCKGETRALTEGQQLHCKCVELSLVLQWLGLLLVCDEQLNNPVHPAHEEAAAVVREGVVLHLFGEQEEHL